jgi:DNA-binding ferritin-like protein
MGRPATTPEAREQQMISLADELAERQLRDGTASAQVITHYLKLGSSRERLEQERLANENILLKAKKEAMDSQARIEEMYGAALNAMRSYAGQPPMELDSGIDDAFD